MTSPSIPKVVYNIHPYAMHLPGGGEVQLLKYYEYLQGHGCDVILHDIWRPRLDEAALFHHFHLVSGGVPFVDYVRKLGMKVLMSPNLWINDTNRAHVNEREIGIYYEQADVIICNSFSEIENLCVHSGLPREKARVLRNGVDPWFAEGLESSIFRRWSGIDGRFLLNVANIEPRKNQLAAIRAARVVGLPLVSIGRVRDPAYFEECVRAGVGGYFRHLGALPQSDFRLRAAYGACEAFVLPSTLETPGIAALEAAAAGARIVITAEGSAREYFGDEVFYVDPCDQDSVIFALRQALASEATGRLQRRIVDDYSWSTVTRDLLHLYVEMQPANFAGRP
ncbi:glycosyltransferase [Thiomonas sp. FB-6]|uniref:glycosyltransferase n=1 Tax=Thiomonas sp. FB-6 TaxID=1158291 RepID=UPI00038160E7|nr:glycosyltransferase [Thiomonas sp. FB-6]